MAWLAIDELIIEEACTMVNISLNDLAPEKIGNIFGKLSIIHIRLLQNTKCNAALPKIGTAYCQK